MWSPDLLDLDFQCKLIGNYSAIEECGLLSSVSSAYRVLNETNTTSYSEGSLVEFQCLHTPYEIDPLLTTECQAGQWNPHPRYICGQMQGVTVMEYGCILHYIIDYLIFYTINAGGISVIASLGAVIALLCLVIVRALSTLLIITHKYRKKGIVILMCIHYWMAVVHYNHSLWQVEVTG